ncbi:hypothetical protein PIB30_026710 [Stylosanthes scabra]|uniref:Uncharacterized protein n=1 Tax=Stylosanthes scabra TaxID=79078 RepID=A0ABU6SA30_9FABA|nr:hypothetical protein [Stylosanthes scabra]
MKRPRLRYDHLNLPVQYKLHRRHLRNGLYDVMKIVWMYEMTLLQRDDSIETTAA